MRSKLADQCVELRLRRGGAVDITRLVRRTELRSKVRDPSSVLGDRPSIQRGSRRRVDAVQGPSSHQVENVDLHMRFGEQSRDEREPFEVGEGRGPGGNPDGPDPTPSKKGARPIGNMVGVAHLKRHAEPSREGTRRGLLTRRS